MIFTKEEGYGSKILWMRYTKKVTVRRSEWMSMGRETSWEARRRFEEWIFELTRELGWWGLRDSVRVWSVHTRGQSRYCFKFLQ